MIKEKTKLWNEPVRISVNQCFVNQIGPLKIWIKKDPNEWSLAWDRIADDESTVILAVDEEKPDDIQWNQWIAGKEESAIQFLPVMPDRSLIIRPQSPTRLGTGLDCVFYGLIPIFVMVSAGSKSELKLCEIPSMVLSNTWHGDTMSGELCYSMRLPAQFSVDNLDVAPHRVVCPIHIKNESEDELEFKRLCVEVKHLNIYQGTPHYWTDLVTVVYRGENQDSKIRYEKRLPNQRKVGALISECREPLSDGILKRGFDNLMSFSF